MLADILDDGIIQNQLDSSQYSPLEKQISQIQDTEAEDPPETLHTPWGIWLHWRDPMHRVHQRFDTAHLIRTGMPAEDIIHYYHYAPIIEGPNEHHAHQSYEMHFEYEYSHQELVYDLNAEIEENLNDGVAEIDFAVQDEDTFKSDEQEQDLEDNDKPIVIQNAEDDSNFEFDMCSMKIIERIIFGRIFKDIKISL